MQHSAGIQTDCIAHFLRVIIGVCQIMLDGFKEGGERKLVEMGH